MDVPVVSESPSVFLRGFVIHAGFFLHWGLPDISSSFVQKAHLEWGEWWVGALSVCINIMEDLLSDLKDHLGNLVCLTL